MPQPQPQPQPIPISPFALTQQSLLLDEHNIEISSSSLATTAASVSPSTRRTLQASGYALTGLLLAQCRTGMGGRVVGEFGADAAVVKKGKDAGDEGGGEKKGEGEARLGAHGIRVGDVVRVNEIGSGSGSGSGGKKGGKEKAGGKEKEKGAGGPEGVVTRVGERSVWVAFGQVGGGGRSKEDDEAIEELWGKKLWLYVGLLLGIGTWEAANGLQHQAGKRCDVSTVSLLYSGSKDGADRAV